MTSEKTEEIEKCEVCGEEISESIEKGICDKCATEDMDYQYQVMVDSRGQY